MSVFVADEIRREPPSVVGTLGRSADGSGTIKRGTEFRRADAP
jgi:hypothetical protein